MAPLEVIGAGVGRTGTDSLRVALDMLGYKTHHALRLPPGFDWKPEAFEEAYKHPESPVDWNYLYEGYSAGVACPTANLVRQLIDFYPDAKVILTVRDADSWYNSVVNTIHKLVADMPESPSDLTMRKMQMLKTIWLDGALQDMEKFLNEPETMKARYEAHNAWVIENVPADRLLVLNLSDGISWESICPFLNKPIPSEPYPHVNTAKSINQEFPRLLETEIGKVASSTT